MKRQWWRESKNGSTGREENQVGREGRKKGGGREMAGEEKRRKIVGGGGRRQEQTQTHRGNRVEVLGKEKKRRPL